METYLTSLWATLYVVGMLYLILAMLAKCDRD